MALLKRLTEHDRPVLPFTLDGQPASGLLGGTLPTAVLPATAHSRATALTAKPRAGSGL
ncbi:(2Fe-2S)-binding protein, partial [Pseudomonas syringae]